ncbi:hypothetical protein G6F22_017939 [Rhizopus arrhizus]|nr:hypothetical protein G6F22_017939 [Rhizopus arrhizus]
MADGDVGGVGTLCRIGADAGHRLRGVGALARHAGLDAALCGGGAVLRGAAGQRDAGAGWVVDGPAPALAGKLAGHTRRGHFLLSAAGGGASAAGRVPGACAVVAGRHRRLRAGARHLGVPPDGVVLLAAVSAAAPRQGIAAGVDGSRAQFAFNAQQAVVLGGAVGAR